MKFKKTDTRVAADRAILDRFRKKAGIDFLKWTDDAASARHVVNSSHNRQGHWSTLQDVRTSTLLSLPPEILDRPVAELEFSIDFVPKQAATDHQRLTDMITIYELLHRRLAPWTGQRVRTAMRRSLAKGHCEMIIKGKKRFGTRSDGTCWTLGAAIPPLTVSMPQNIAGDLVKSHAVYFGDEVQPSWSNLPQSPKPMVQVKLYIKITDNNFPIPRAKWRTRMEVTLNAPLLSAILGVRTVRDMQHADMRKLTKEFLRLYSPQPVRMKRAKTCSPALSAMVDAHWRGLARAVDTRQWHGATSRSLKKGWSRSRRPPISTSRYWPPAASSNAPSVGRKRWESDVCDVGTSLVSPCHDRDWPAWRVSRYNYYYPMTYF